MNSKSKGNISFSSESIMLYLFKEMIKWRRDSDEAEFQWSDFHLSIVRDYFSSFSRTCDFRELPSTTFFIDNFSSDKPRSLRIFAAASFTHELQHWFMVPRLNKLDDGDNRIKKYQLVEAFISFILQLLYHKTDSIIHSCDNQIFFLEVELRFLLTILGDISWMLCDNEHEEFQNLLAEFEAVANKSGRLVHSLFFSMDRAFGKMSKGLCVVLDHVDLLKADIIKFLNLLPSIRGSVYITPKTSVLDSLLVVDSLICDLEDLIKREDNRIADVKDQIKILHQGLLLSQSSIKDIGSPKPSEIGELKEPLMRMGDVAHEAEYLIISFSVGDAPFWYFIIRLIDVNRKIELIGTELQEITRKHKIGQLKVAEYFSAPLPLQAKSYTKVDDITVGFEDKETYILDQLVGGGTEHLQVISICGMAGLGKTTFAKKLYNHPSVNYWFYKLSWCVISQTYFRKSIMADILIHIGSKLGKDRILEMEEESLLEHIYKALKGRRYLIVMDDIWDPIVWDDLQRCFPDDGNGSRVLFTSRNKDVAPPNSIIYALPSLSNDQCWALLKKKVFDNEPCTPELIEIGKEIAANCCGLPLVVVVIAGILSTMDKKKSTWEEVGGNIASYVFNGGDNSVMQILELSYKHLPDRLKPCFLYFGAFEKDNEIPARKLMRRWIAEGFIHKEEDEEKSAEQVAEEYLMELINKSLVMVAKRRRDGGVKACVIHDLLHDLCLKRSKDENFMKLVNNNIYSIFEKGCRLRVLEYRHVIPIYCQHVRSFSGHSFSTHSRDPVPLYIRNMRLLRVMHFDYIYNHYYIGIEYLVNLRYLVITYLPPSIGSLVNLEYLRVSSHWRVKVPPAIGKMKKLRYVEASPDAEYDKDWNSSQTNNLEFLSCVIISNEEMLKCSPNLRKLKCEYKLEEPVKKKKKKKNRANTSPHFDLHFLNQLDSLELTFSSLKLKIVLEEFGFPSNIRKLILWGSAFRLRWGKMSIFGRLENLEVLELSLIDFEGERWDTRDGEFQKLRSLKLHRPENLTDWNVASSQHFPKLQRLVLWDCFNLHEIPCEIGEIATMQLIELEGGCPLTLVESAKRIQQEQLDMGNEELRLFIRTVEHRRDVAAPKKSRKVLQKFFRNCF